ncbi:DUF368 domain-containing protein [Microbulbifer hydrolyticus]|uniref:DUF368 domain-containing protein n=1 Tax=Microbulbifer hydrolyticus TaxID=48074 RepID=A0A6P1TAT2_9GAMM|nr:DUF368 domain-containing protein [Microbulbifer hydrolyticus]MBB5210818.1 putative membrane protein [Microbulbifer hydrolyticus]QHQ38746.1 DUF368 domain-containing protein [Microbulbifer hydrolyticus]
MASLWQSRYLGVAARGLAMGAADVVPGVSGGTIAFITGIYQELLDSLSRIGPHTVSTLFKEGVAVAWRQINGTFLLALFSGILTSIFSLARLISYLLEHYPIVVWGFFFGLILASVVPIVRRIPRWSWQCWLALLLGGLLAVLVSEMRPTEIAATPYTLFFSGALAICAMILPGISGSFILLMIGIYPQVIAAVHQFQLSALTWFGAGAVTGLLLFSRLLSWLMHRFPSVTLSFLVGILLGSLKIVWPWKLAVGEAIGSTEKLAPMMSNVFPGEFSAVSGEPSYIVGATMASVVAVLLVLAIEWFHWRHVGNVAQG